MHSQEGMWCVDKPSWALDGVSCPSITTNSLALSHVSSPWNLGFESGKVRDGIYISPQIFLQLRRRDCWAEFPKQMKTSRGMRKLMVRVISVWFAFSASHKNFHAALLSDTLTSCNGQGDVVSHLGEWLLPPEIYTEIFSASNSILCAVFKLPPPKVVGNENVKSGKNFWTANINSFSWPERSCGSPRLIKLVASRALWETDFCQIIWVDAWAPGSYTSVRKASPASQCCVRRWSKIGAFLMERRRTTFSRKRLESI